MSQIIKTTFSKDIIYNFLKEFCDITNKFYVFSKTTFKKIKLQNKNPCSRFGKYRSRFY